MTSRRRTAAVAAKTTELFVAAPQVVALRMMRMAEHGSRPSAHDRAEMFRMGNEKVLAFSRAWMGMWMQCWLAPLHFLRSDWMRASANAMTAVAAAGVAPVHRTATANARRLTRLARRR
jgi:hypothetical protein